MKIKKYAIIMLFCSVVILSSLPPLTNIAKSNTKTITNETYMSTLQLLLFPYIQEEVHNRYGKYAQVDIYGISFESINIQSPIDITLTIVVMPYTGPHNTISTDKVTIQINLNQITITDYISISQ